MSEKEKQERGRNPDEETGPAARDTRPRGMDQEGAGLKRVEREIIAERDDTFDPIGEQAHVDGRVEYLRRHQGDRGGDSGMRE